MHWTLEQLKTLLAVVEHGSFSKAAGALNLSQPAVSVQIRTLERETGRQLLERRPRKLVLTDAGRILYNYARRLQQMERDFLAEFSELERLQRGSLRVGAGATPSIFTLAGLFSEYYRRWPSVELEVQIARTAELVKGVLDDTLDLAIVSSDIQASGLVRTPLYVESCVVVVGKGHRLSGKQRLTLSELASQPSVLLPASSGFRKFLDARLAEHSLSINPAMELASLEAIKEVVREGTLVSIVPETAARGESSRSGLNVLEIDGPPLYRTTSAIRRGDKYVSEAMRAFYRLLGEHWPQGTSD